MMVPVASHGLIGYEFPSSVVRRLLTDNKAPSRLHPTDLYRTNIGLPSVRCGAQAPAQQQSVAATHHPASRVHPHNPLLRQKPNSETASTVSHPRRSRHCTSIARHHANSARGRVSASSSVEPTGAAVAASLDSERLVSMVEQLAASRNVPEAEWWVKSLFTFGLKIDYGAIPMEGIIPGTSHIVG